MKYFSLFIIFLTTTIFNGCCIGCSHKYYNAPFYLTSNVINIDNNLYMAYYGKIDQAQYNINKMYLYRFDSNTIQWTKIATKNDTMIILDDYKQDLSSIKNIFKKLELTYYPEQKYQDILIADLNSYAIFDTNEVTFKDIETNETFDSYLLPTKDDITSNLHLNIDTIFKIEYYPFFNELYTKKMKSFIVLLIANIKDVHGGTKADCYYIHIYYKDNTWKYNLLKNTNEFAYHDSKLSQHRSIDYNGSILDISYSTLRFNEIITIKDYKIQILPLKNRLDESKKQMLKIKDKQYLFTGDKIYSGNYGISTFDEQGNMHLFYNKREDIINNNYNYFWYGYFTKENPTTPLYEQKIPWEGE